jgi:hypothetical protein
MEGANVIQKKKEKINKKEHWVENLSDISVEDMASHQYFLNQPTFQV